MSSFGLVPSRLVVFNALYKLLPMNFLLVKLNHHLLGLPSPPSSYTLANNLFASSCRTWARYCRNCSASCRSLGGSYICNSSQYTDIV